MRLIYQLNKLTHRGLFHLHGDDAHVRDVHALHHQRYYVIFNTGGQSEQEALELALSTWPQDITPVVHYSESKNIHQGEEKPTPAHSDIVYGPINTYDNTMDIMVEAKHKEFAIYALNNNVL